MRGRGEGKAGEQGSDPRTWCSCIYILTKQKNQKKLSFARNRCFISLVQYIRPQTCTWKGLTAATPNYTEKQEMSHKMPKNKATPLRLNTVQCDQKLGALSYVVSKVSWVETLIAGRQSWARLFSHPFHCVTRRVILLKERPTPYNNASVSHRHRQVEGCRWGWGLVVIHFTILLGLCNNAAWVSQVCLSLSHPLSISLSHTHYSMKACQCHRCERPSLVFKRR